MVMTVQSSSVSGKELVRRIGHFVDTEHTTILQELSKDQFSDFKEAVIHKLLEPDQRLTQQASRFWSEIINSNSHYNRLKQPLFDRSLIEANVIESIQWSDFMAFVQDYILPGGKSRRLLVSEIDGNKVHIEEESIAINTTFDLIPKEMEFNVHSNKM